MTGYYVSIIRSAKQRGLLLGPYDLHETALKHVEYGKKLAVLADPWADFDAFGTCKIETEKELPKSVFGC